MVTLKGAEERCGVGGVEMNSLVFLRVDLFLHSCLLSDDTADLCDGCYINLTVCPVCTESTEREGHRER